MNLLETKENVINSKKSIIRFGDGEFNIIGGKNVHYQVHSIELENELNQIIQQYINNPSNVDYIVCMPRDFFKVHGFRIMHKRLYISSWAYSRYIFKNKYDREISYGDAFMFARGNENIYKEIWKNENVKNIVFVHNNEKYAKKFENKYSIKTESVVIPESNSFEVKDSILADIIKKAAGKEELLVLISAGPCAKYLVKELSKRKIWAIDTGHCWDDPLEGM
jgi:hypothetical protein